MTTRIVPQHDHTTAKQRSWEQTKASGHRPACTLERDLQPAVALTAPTGMLTASHTSLPARGRDFAARVHTACRVSCPRLPCSCPLVCCPIACALHASRVSGGSVCARYRWGARCFWQPRKEYHQLADHGRAGLILSCSALPRSRARRIARAGHMRDSTCHSAYPFVACVGWGVGDSKSAGGGKRSCCRFGQSLGTAASLRAPLPHHAWSRRADAQHCTLRDD